jgi:hypothetical protein
MFKHLIILIFILVVNQLNANNLNYSLKCNTRDTQCVLIKKVNLKD